MSIQSEVENRMREVLFQRAQQIEEDLKIHKFSSAELPRLREMFLPDDFSRLSWNFIREMKDSFLPREWNAIWNYHTTHEKEEKEFRQYFEKYGNRKYGYSNSYEYNQKELYKNRHGKEIWE